MHEVDGLNAGYASALLEQYLENPEAVPSEWRSLFESGASELVATHPGLARLVELLHEDGNGHVATTRRSGAGPAWARRGRACPVRGSGRGRTGQDAAGGGRGGDGARQGLSARTATSPRASTHSGSEPVGDPSLEPGRLEPKLTPELQRLIPADILARPRPGRDAGRRAPAAARDLLRHERLRDRAHLRPRAARLAALRDRVGPLPPAARRGREAPPARAPDARSRASSATCGARSSARSSSRSRAWT